MSTVREGPRLVDIRAWEPVFVRFLGAAAESADAAHDLDHVRRVVTTAMALADREGARVDVVHPAAWLHDCVSVPKDSPDRSRASALAAARAAELLGGEGYPADAIPSIEHAIAAHSFSAGVRPRTLEARVVQDADRLDALGAVGIARWAMVGASLGNPLYVLDDPFCRTRAPDDARAMVDHFYTKLLTLADTMQTDAGRAEARRRTAFMRAFLDQLASEIGVSV